MNMCANTDRPFNVLILNPDLPYFPGRIGCEYLITTRLAAVASQVGVVSMVHDREQYEKRSSLLDAGVRLWAWENSRARLPESAGPSGLRRPSRVRLYLKRCHDWVAALSGRPIDTFTTDRGFRNMAGPLWDALKEEKWHALIVVQSQCARFVDYVPPFPVSVLVLHDIRSLVYERRASTAGNPLARWLYALEARRYYRFEKKYCRRYDLVATVSSTDEAWVKKNYQPHQSIAIPLSVDADYFSPQQGEAEVPGRIVFTGLMNHPPNVDAVCYFARDVFPRVRERVPRAEFWVVGREPSDAVLALASLPGVTVTGYVPDIRIPLAQADVVVVPLRYGSGVRNKILEAWGMQKCVISSTVGAEGLDCRDGDNIIIADDPRRLAAAVVSALEHPEVRDKVRQSGRQVVLRDHRAEQQAARFYGAIRAIAENKRKLNGPRRFLIDLRWMKPGLAGGIENLARSFLKELARVDPINHYIVWVPAEALDDLADDGHPHMTRVASDGFRSRGRALFWKTQRFLRRRFHVGGGMSRAVEFLHRLHRWRVDGALSLSGYLQDDVLALPNVLVFVDLQHEFYPQFFSPRVLEERRRIVAASVSHSSRILCISNHTRQSLLARYPVDPRCVSTAYLAADPVFEAAAQSAVQRPGILSQYGLDPGAYLFFPGHTWPHKNHKTALRVLKRVREMTGRNLMLVCTGNAKEAHADIVQEIGRLALTGCVRFLGYCPLKDMPALYQGALALMYPSYFEGFGLPLVEAMWSGCPVVCSDAGSLPEVGGEAALYANPDDVIALAGHVMTLMNDAGARERLIQAGRKQARLFSWRSFAVSIVQALQETSESQWR